jgi:protein TonB
VDISELPPSATVLRRAWSRWGNLLPPHLVAGVTGSGLVHGTVTAAVLAAMVFSVFSPWHVPSPKPGVSSIALVASFEAAPDEADAADLPVVEISLLEPPIPEMAEAASALATHEKMVLEAPLLPICPSGELPARLLARADVLEPADVVIVSAPPESHIRKRQPQMKPPPKVSHRSPPKKSELRPPTTDVTAVTAEQPLSASVPSRASSGARSSAPVRKLYSPEPEYPADALAAGLTGRVVVRVVIGKDGRVVRAGIQQSSGVPSLDASALAAVRQWRFEPILRGGVAVVAAVPIPVQFRIESRAAGSY